MLLLAGALLLLLPERVFAFRCSGRIISEGDLVDVVVTKCGEAMGAVPLRCD
jgi:hypothetical protein